MTDKPVKYRVREGCTFQGQHRSYSEGEEIDADELPRNVECQLHLVQPVTTKSRKTAPLGDPEE